MTEEEAKTKWCPNEGIFKCLGSECMAWRWKPLTCGKEWIAAVHKRAEETGEKGERPKAAKWVQENRAELGLPDKPTEGYCGLAGRPEV